MKVDPETCSRIVLSGSRNRGSVVTIGTFDGVHRGHQKIVSTVKQFSKKLRAPSLALTFKVPPRHYFHPSPAPFLLTTPEEKELLLKKFGMDKIVHLAFDSRFRKISARSFFEKIIHHQWNARAVVVGTNFGFGKDRQGNPELLKRWGKKFSVQVEVVPPVRFRNCLVSSGRIRDFLKDGNLQRANELLGYPYFLIGKVIAGRGLGKKLGFPTANLSVPAEKILPAGVFIVRVTIFKARLSPAAPNSKLRTLNYFGMCNVGFRPTVANSSSKLSVEAHLFHFSSPLVGKSLKLEFLHKMRNEKQFGSLGELKKQLELDRKRAFTWLKQKRVRGSPR